METSLAIIGGSEEKKLSALRAWSRQALSDGDPRVAGLFSSIGRANSFVHKAVKLKVMLAQEDSDKDELEKKRAREDQELEAFWDSLLLELNELSSG